MSENNNVGGASRNGPQSGGEIRSEMEAAYRAELQNAKTSGAASDDAGLRSRASARVRASHPEADPASLEHAAWEASQALRSLGKN
jgi:hypothetical protein